MKKYLLSLSLSLCIIGLQAQEGDLVIKGTKQINEKLTPKEVLDSLHARFPDAQSVKYYQQTLDQANKGWAVSTEDNLNASDEVDYYTIKFKREDMDYYGLYDKNGNMLKAKMEVKLDELPKAVQDSLNVLSQRFPGYKIISKTHYRELNYSKDKEYFAVIAQQGQVKKQVYYTADGKLIQVKTL
jgi:hypothetical protein